MVGTAWASPPRALRGALSLTRGDARLLPGPHTASPNPNQQRQVWSSSQDVFPRAERRGWGVGWVSMLLPTGAQGARGVRRQRGLWGVTLLPRHGLGRPLVPMAQGRAPLQSGLGPLPLGLALPGTLAQTQRRGRGAEDAPLTLTPANETDGAAPPSHFAVFLETGRFQAADHEHPPRSSLWRLHHWWAESHLQPRQRGDLCEAAPAHHCQGPHGNTQTKVMVRRTPAA